MGRLFLFEIRYFHSLPSLSHLANVSGRNNANCFVQVHEAMDRRICNSCSSSCFVFFVFVTILRKSQLCRKSLTCSLTLNCATLSVRTNGGCPSQFVAVSWAVLFLPRSADRIIHFRFGLDSFTNSIGNIVAIVRSFHFVVASLTIT